jgi:signal transduction histidine kinase
MLSDDDLARILIVDDQTSNLDAIDALLSTTGCTLVRAQSANEALLALLDHEFAAIILDIRMPGMDGLELAELIKQRRRTRDVPLLFLTAHVMDERDVLRGYGTGAVDYLTKPVHAEVLRSKVAVFVELYRKTHALARANASLEREIAKRELAQDELRRNNAELERRVQERTEALSQADRRKDEFLASLAHELRNPLAPIRSAVEILQAAPAPEPQYARARDVIVRQVDQMRRLIDDLMDVSRITSDKLILQVSRIDLMQVVSIAVETSRPLIVERKHNLHVTLPDPPLALDADPARLAQVLANLLTNAAKYTPEGGDISLTGTVKDGELVIAVRDNGLGIEPQMASRIFELFTQGDGSHAGPAGGLGVGLALARRIVEMHGGRIEMRSEGFRRGSEFSVRLPLHARLSAAKPPAADPEPPLTSAKRILIVDDNQDSAEMFAALLTAWGQQTCVAFDGAAALAAAEQFQPDVVLLDLGMPHMDGYETARRIRTAPWGRRAVLVAVTGWGLESDLERTRQAGFEHHLVKPVAPLRLRSVIAGTQRPDSP